MCLVVAILGLIALVACSTTPSTPPPATPNPQPVPQPTPLPQTPIPSLPNGAPVDPSALYVFSGEVNPTFLGCLSCGEYDVSYSHNPYGLYGSDYSITSIFNKSGFYGSTWSLYSACNESTLTPPVVVTGAGGYVGRLTVNQAHVEIIRDAYGWLTGVVCI